MILTTVRIPVDHKKLLLELVAIDNSGTMAQTFRDAIRYYLEFRGKITYNDLE